MKTIEPKRPINYRPSIVMDGAASADVKSVAIAVIMAAFITLVLGSKALLGWANDLPIGRVSDFLLMLAQTWQDWMDKYGATGIAEAAFHALRWLQALRW